MDIIRHKYNQYLIKVGVEPLFSECGFEKFKIFYKKIKYILSKPNYQKTLFCFIQDHDYSDTSYSWQKECEEKLLRVEFEERVELFFKFIRDVVLPSDNFFFISTCNCVGPLWEIALACEKKIWFNPKATVGSFLSIINYDFALVEQDYKATALEKYYLKSIFHQIEELVKLPSLQIVQFDEKWIEIGLSYVFSNKKFPPKASSIFYLNKNFSSLDCAERFFHGYDLKQTKDLLEKKLIDQSPQVFSQIGKIISIDIEYFLPSFYLIEKILQEKFYIAFYCRCSKNLSKQLNLLSSNFHEKFPNSLVLQLWGHRVSWFVSDGNVASCDIRYVEKNIFKIQLKEKIYHCYEINFDSNQSFTKMVEVSSSCDDKIRDISFLHSVLPFYFFNSSSNLLDISLIDLIYCLFYFELLNFSASIKKNITEVIDSLEQSGWNLSFLDDNQIKPRVKKNQWFSSMSQRFSFEILNVKNEYKENYNINMNQHVLKHYIDQHFLFYVCLIFYLFREKNILKQDEIDIVLFCSTLYPSRHGKVSTTCLRYDKKFIDQYFSSTSSFTVNILRELYYDRKFYRQITK